MFAVSVLLKAHVGLDEYNAKNCCPKVLCTVIVFLSLFDGLTPALDLASFFWSSDHPLDQISRSVAFDPLCDLSAHKGPG